MLTGTGVEHVFGAAEGQGCLAEMKDALGRAIIVCRGPKPTSALRRRGINPAWIVPEPHTTAALLATVQPLAFLERDVLIVLAGESTAEPAATLTHRGARVTELEMYEWQLTPDNARMLTRAIADIVDGRVDAIAFTSQIQVRYLFETATRIGATHALLGALEKRVLVGAVGDTCADAIRSYGMTPDVLPEHPKMGHLVVAMAHAIRGRAAASAIRGAEFPLTNRRPSLF